MFLKGPGGGGGRVSIEVNPPRTVDKKKVFLSSIRGDGGFLNFTSARRLPEHKDLALAPLSGPPAQGCCLLIRRQLTPLTPGVSFKDSEPKLKSNISRSNFRGGCKGSKKSFVDGMIANFFSSRLLPTGTVTFWFWRVNTLFREAEVGSAFLLYLSSFFGKSYVSSL